VEVLVVKRLNSRKKKPGDKRGMKMLSGTHLSVSPKNPPDQESTKSLDNSYYCSSMLSYAA
jgi:hypothetical protein